MKKTISLNQLQQRQSEEINLRSFDYALANDVCVVSSDKS